MKTDAKRQVIMVAVDWSAASQNAIETAVELAASTKGELHVLHVLSPPALPSGGMPPLPSLVEDARAFVRDVAAKAGGGATAHIATGDPHTQIVEMARELSADLIVLGWHERGALTRFMHRSISERVANDAPCAVLVARPKDRRSTVPEIEPPCPDCVDVRAKSAGTAQWCATHSIRHRPTQLHYSSPPSYGGGSLFISDR